MQEQLCAAFSKYYPMVEASLVLDETPFVDFLDQPLLHAAAGANFKVVFTRQTDMRSFCFSPTVSLPPWFSSLLAPTPPPR